LTSKEKVIKKENRGSIYKDEIKGGTSQVKPVSLYQLILDLGSDEYDKMLSCNLEKQMEVTKNGWIDLIFNVTNLPDIEVYELLSTIKKRVCEKSNVRLELYTDQVLNPEELDVVCTKEFIGNFGKVDGKKGIDLGKFISQNTSLQAVHLFGEFTREGRYNALLNALSSKEKTVLFCSKTSLGIKQEEVMLPKALPGLPELEEVMESLGTYRPEARKILEDYEKKHQGKIPGSFSDFVKSEISLIENSSSNSGENHREAEHTNLPKTEEKKNKEKIKEYQQKNKEKIKEYQQKNKERIKEYKKKYNQRRYQENKEKLKEYRENNKEKANKHKQEYYQKNEISLVGNSSPNSGENHRSEEHTNLQEGKNDEGSWNFEAFEAPGSEENDQGSDFQTGNSQEEGSYNPSGSSDQNEIGGGSLRGKKQSSIKE
jgi:gas vesicle protein